MPKQTIDLILQLRALGMTDEHFRALHHMGNSIAQHEKYCRGIQTPTFTHNSSNARIRERLAQVLEARRAGHDWKAALGSALEAIPLKVNGPKHTRWDPRLFERHPDAERVLAIQSRLAWVAIVAARELRDALAMKQVEHLVRRSIWAVTEVARTNDCKYWRQRFLSVTVRDGFRDAGSRPPSCKGLQHEHVVQLRGLVERLLLQREEHDLRCLLGEATACVVTKAEHARLKPFDHLNGWNRYREAGIPVWDRLDQKFVV